MIVAGLIALGVQIGGTFFTVAAVVGGSVESGSGGTGSGGSGDTGGEQNAASAENKNSGRIGGGRGAAGSGDEGGGFGAGNLSLLAIILLLLFHWFSERMKRAAIRRQQAADSRSADRAPDSMMGAFAGGLDRPQAWRPRPTAGNRQAALARRMSFGRAG